MATKRSTIDWREALIRLLVVFGVVFATYNPTGYSYVHWMAQDSAGPISLKIAVGIFLLIVFYVLLSVTYSAFKTSGLIAGAATAIVFSVQSLFLSLPASKLDSFDEYILFTLYVMLMSLAFVIGFGMSWSKFVRWLTGQESKRYVRRAN